MKLSSAAVTAAVVWCQIVGPSGRCRAASPVDEVDPKIGTGWHSHTYPGATVPFGFVQLSPDTPLAGWDGTAGYHASDDTILGFSHTHLSGTGVGDLGDVLLLPMTGGLPDGSGSMDCRRLGSEFRHDRETASPGYYAVDLDRYHVRAELTATAHAGLHRYAFPAGEAGEVLVDLVHGVGGHVKAAELNVVNDHRLTGSRRNGGWNPDRTLYFVIDASRPFAPTLELEDKPAADHAKAAGKHVRAVLGFKADPRPLLVRVGLSAVSVEQAVKNLDTEMPAADFDAVHAAARKQWDDTLSRLTIASPDPTLRRTFYTALYHALLAPTLFNDADGTYRGIDGRVHANEGFANYSTMSLWDTFRAEHPLLTLVTPERVGDFVRSALAVHDQSKEHALPMWPLAGAETHCMIGYHAVPMIYDAYAKGFTGFDPKAALTAMTDTALRSPNCPSDYDTRGYVVCETKKRSQGVARTLEYSYDDWCVARMAEALGDKDTAGHFGRRANYFANLFDADTGFFRGRTATGAWRTPFDPKAIDFDDYTEANAWQYAFFVPHDVPAMIKLSGGPAAFVAKLDACFDQPSDLHAPLVDVTGLVGQYSHGNEPDQHAAYLYALAGDQDRTARRVRQIMRQEYDDTPEGLCGNDDCGQTSAWFVWSAIGLYPLNPADGRYVIASPAVKSATLRLDPKFASGRTFTVLAPKASRENLYVKSATLNGKPLDRPWVTHAEVMRGGTLELDMGLLPAGLWKTAGVTD